MINRYARQKILPQIGESGQARLHASHIAIVGCGALGTVSAELLARAGVGHLTIIDRDVVEITNLQRQLVFAEQDVEERLPKALAAARRLKQINSTIEISPHVVDFNYRNADSLLESADLIVDGTDNYLARLLINDVAVKQNKPWIYGGAIGMTGMVMPIIPQKTACFRCMVTELPPAGQMDTCDLVGVLGSVTSTVASLQVAYALRVLVDGTTALTTELIEFNLWSAEFRQLTIPRDQGCRACVMGETDFLLGSYSREALSLCGRDSVQVWPSDAAKPDFESVARRLGTLGEVFWNRFTLRFTPAHEEITLTLFGDGRAVISGILDVNQALGIYTRYLG